MEHLPHTASLCIVQAIVEFKKLFPRCSICLFLFSLFFPFWCSLMCTFPFQRRISQQETEIYLHKIGSAHSLRSSSWKFVFGMLKNQYGISTICFADIFHISCSFISQQIELTDSTMCTCIYCILHTVGHRLWFPYGLNVYTTNKKFEITASFALFTPFNDCNANKYCLKFNIHHSWNKFRQKRWTMFSALCVYENWFCANIVFGCFGKVFG